MINSCVQRVSVVHDARTGFDGVLDGVYAGMLDDVFDGRHQYPNFNRLLSKAVNGVLDEVLDVGHQQMSTSVKAVGRCLGTE